MTTLRRFVLVAAALILSVPLLRPAISSALVTRGDALLYANDARARDKYALALWFDGGNMVAADRYVFSAFLSREPNELASAVRIARVVLRAFPGNTAVRMDRALCLQLLRRYAQAERDFEAVGRERNDVQALALAASDARIIGNAAKARRLLAAAERIDPLYVPVRFALERGFR